MSADSPQVQDLHSLQRFNPLIARMRSRVGGASTFRDHASRSWIIQAEETACVPSALFDPADLQRITGVGADDTLEEQIQRARGGATLHRATVAYELRDAILSRGHLFTRRVHHALSARRAPLLADRPTQVFSHAVLASSPYGLKYFGHWMADDLPLLLAAREIGHPVSVLTNPSPAQRRYAELLDLNVEAAEDAFFDRIVVIDDVGQNAHKRARFQKLRRMAAPLGTGSPLPGVMLLRGMAGVSRVLLNEDEIANVAQQRGFRVIDPIATDAAEIMGACIGTKLVIGVEGSNLTNGMMWMSREGTLVAIQPPSRFMVILKDWCDCIGVRYAFVLGEPGGNNAFRVNVDAVQRMLDIAMR